MSVQADEHKTVSNSDSQMALKMGKNYSIQSQQVEMPRRFTDTIKAEKRKPNFQHAMSEDVDEAGFSSKLN